MQNFYIERIELHNYRKFENVEFKLDRNMNLLIGENASGKTTILEAVTVALGAYLAAYRTYVPSRFVRNISDSDVRRKGQRNMEPDVLVGTGIEQYPCYIASELMINEKKHYYKRVVEKKDNRTKFSGSNPMQKMVMEWEKAIKAGDGTDAKFIFPLVLYLSSGRLWKENRSSDFNYDIPNRTDAYHRCLDSNRGMQIPFNYIRHLKEVAAQEKKGVDFPAYTLIMDAINKSMEEEMAEGERIEYSLRYNGLAVVDSDGTWIPFDGLSDGYRNVIKIVADIATRMCILNPYLKEDTLEKTPGVVIIDELDLSLHPKWQKADHRYIDDDFPESAVHLCQPLALFDTISEKKGKLISMDGEIEEEYYSQSIEDIAENIMDVENPQYSEERQKMYESAEAYFAGLERATDREALKEIKEELERLTARFGDNPAYYAFLNQKYLSRASEIGGKE